MKVHHLVSTLAGLAALAISASGQTTATTTSTTRTTSGFAPANFGDMLFTHTPGNATSGQGITSVFGSNGATLTLGTGGALVNPALFNYSVTGSNTATITNPAMGSSPASTTHLTFTSETGGTYSTTSGGTTTTGTFSLAEMPSSPAIANVSVRTTLTGGETTSVGFVVGGTMPRQVLIRAVGPGLSNFGVNSGLSNPSFTVYSGTRAIATNDDWGTMAAIDTGSGSGSGSDSGTGSGTDAGNNNNDNRNNNGGTTTGPGSGNTTAMATTSLATAQTFTQLGAFGLTNGSRDAATVVTLPPGPYTVQVMNSTTTTGTGTGTGAGAGGTGSGTGTTGTGGTGTGGTSTGGTDSGTGTGGTSTTTAATNGDVLVEVYFVE